MKPNEKLNVLLRTEARQNLLDALAHGFVDWAFDQGLFRSCLNCAHWNSETSKIHPPETCGKFSNMRPPARIIVTGCPDHSDNIPF